MNATFSLKKIQYLAKEFYGLEGEFKALPGEVDLNYLVSVGEQVSQDSTPLIPLQRGSVTSYNPPSEGVEGGDIGRLTKVKKYVLKIASADTDLERLKMQNEALVRVRQQVPEVRTQDVLPNKDGEYLTSIMDENGQQRYLRVLTYLEGNLWANVRPHTPELLESLGGACALLCKGLDGYEHPAAHFDFKWNSSEGRDWVKARLTHVKNPERRQIIEHFLGLFENKFLPQKDELRTGIIQNDANDYNVIVDAEKQEVRGILDFGDMIHTHVVNDIAIAIAYAAMHKPDPLTAATDVVRGFHRTFSLHENELDVLWTMIGMRLCISVVNSAINIFEYPENEYLQISDKAAWDLLEKIYLIPAEQAHYTFRDACGLEAHPGHSLFVEWAKQQEPANIVDIDIREDNIPMLDLSVGSLELGNNSEFYNTRIFTQKVFNHLDNLNVSAGLGAYGEARPVYTTDAFASEGNQGQEWRTVHLGLDVFMPAESIIYAPVAGIVHSFQNNAIEDDYGPTIILEHQVSDELTFYTLYGHLSLDSLEGLEVGMSIGKGQAFAKMGNETVNGGWPPHLHFQVMLDIFDYKGNYPGVAYFAQQEVWKSICPNPGLLLGVSGLPKTHCGTADILKKRKKHLAKNLSISYNKPLHMVRGYMQYLYDATGRRYLDTVNNVAHVGHEHPRVVEAARKQIAVLNTNTRYLHENLVAFAEELAAMFPAPLDTCFFTNSGSEANELAMRIAKTVTGRSGMAVLEIGYHGNTNACVDVSSYKFDGKGGRGAPPGTHKVPMPDIYRGIYRENVENPGLQYAKHLEHTLRKMAYLNQDVAAFIAEPIMSCGGQIVLPKGYLKSCFEQVRAAGGLCIVDEVQHGFGRIGEHFWGFELHDVVPDIVTMGKPIGNGHPMGAVITSSKLADVFANGMEYFTTFGGNPVSCAIGREVLQIVKDEELQQNALKTGNYLKAGLSELQQKYPIIGDVRGHGFFLGFELVNNNQDKIPVPKQTSYLSNRMRRLGVLTSTDGPEHNVIKIKPPMVFTKQNADFMLDMLDMVFAEDVMQV